MKATFSVLHLLILGYLMPMINWLHDPQAVYVITAYGAVFAGLLGLLAVSWREKRRRQAEWRRLDRQRKA